MDNVKFAHNGGSIVSDDGALVSVVDELVHSARTERRGENLADCVASVDVRDQLTKTLRLIGSFTEENDRGTDELRHENGQTKVL